jgi:hypothetical protein
MSSEPDYNFNQPVVAQSDSFSLQLPFALLSTAIAILMVAQTVGVIRTGNALHDNKTKYADALRNREALVKQSGEIQNKLQALILDLLLLSKTDEDAKAIVSKYNIQQNGNAAAPGAAPAPAEGAK